MEQLKKLVLRNFELVNLSLECENKEMCIKYYDLIDENERDILEMVDKLIFINQVKNKSVDIEGIKAYNKLTDKQKIMSVLAQF